MDHEFLRLAPLPLLLQRIPELEEQAAVADHAVAFLQAAAICVLAVRVSPSVTGRRAN